MAFIIACQYGAGVQEKKYTPKDFLNHTTISKKAYLKDSNAILEILKTYLNNHEQSFYNKEYFDSTEITIDTILYSMDLKKMAVFAITKTPMYRRNEVARVKNAKYWYDAYCYIGIRTDTASYAVKLKWVKASSMINWYKKSEISHAIKDGYFTEFATIKDTSGEYRYKYNLDDKRFWDSPIWDEYFAK
ncbi:hypothetical protein BW716_03010 [[Flexibacter] sp. ATCC 35208]|nr:hypothetical protein BW716_03010 [[Flexibacter] sp. ATCC 35208]